MGNLTKKAILKKIKNKKFFETESLILNKFIIPKLEEILNIIKLKIPSKRGKDAKRV